MKRTTSFVLMGLVAVAIAQTAPIVFRDSKKNPTIILQGDRGFVVPEESFELSGNVVLKQIPDSLTLTCGKAAGKIAKASGKTEVDNVRLTGGVKVTVDNKGFLVTVNGSTADYDLQSSLRVIKLKGNASFNFKAKNEPASSLDAKSSNADISLSRADNIVQTASLTGGVTLNTVEIQKVDNGFKRVKFNVKAQTLRFSEKGEDGTREVRLEKDIAVTRSGDEGDAEVTGAQILILNLNNDNEVIRSRFSSGGVGQVKTTLKKGGR